MKKFILAIALVSIIAITVLYFLFGNPGVAGFTNSSASISNPLNGDIQEVSMDLSYEGYNPSTLYIKKDVPVRWNINVIQMTGCTSAIMIESLGIKKDLQIGENIIEFTPPANVDEIKFSCGMKMVWGKFVITGNGNKPAGAIVEKENKDFQNHSGCGSNSVSSTCGCSNHQ